MRSLAIIIVNYNTADILRDCLRHISTLGPEECKVIVVDNDSGDGSAQMVKNEFDWVDLINTKNNGLAAGYNLGLEHAPNSDYYLFLGTDAFPKKNCIEGVISYMESRSDVGVATAKLVLRDGSLDRDAHRGFPTPWTALTHFSGLDRVFSESQFFNRYFMGWCNMETPHEIDMCISHFMMVKKEVFKKVGQWDENFFVYGEDVDFCWRVKEAGFKIFYLPQYECLHYKGISVGIRKETSDVNTVNDETKIRMKKETTRAMNLFYKKHMDKRYPKVLNKVVCFGIHIMKTIRK